MENGNVQKIQENNNAQNTNRLIITEWLTLAAIFLGCFLFLHTEIKSIDSRIESRMLSQEQRTDQLYSIWCSTQKEICDLRAESNKIYYEIMKEGKK